MIHVSWPSEEDSTVWKDSPHLLTHSFSPSLPLYISTLLLVNYHLIQGKNRDGGNYYWIAQNALSNAVAANYPGADEASTILAAPEFFSEKYNSGEYTDSELAWGDVNAWQAGDTATHPQGTTSTAFDALDAIMEAFANKTVYPNLNNLTFVGHGE